jgi:hypothetical protein
MATENEHARGSQNTKDFGQAMFARGFGIDVVEPIEAEQRAVERLVCELEIGRVHSPEIAMWMPFARDREQRLRQVDCGDAIPELQQTRAGTSGAASEIKNGGRGRGHEVE